MGRTERRLALAVSSVVIAYLTLQVAVSLLLTQDLTVTRRVVGGLLVVVEVTLFLRLHSQVLRQRPLGGGDPGLWAIMVVCLLALSLIHISEPTRRS